MENLEQKLTSLEIGGKEIIVYISLLKLKKATVIQLAKNSGIKRTSVYHCLDSLINKGLASRIVKDSAKYYIAENPEIAIKNIIEEKRSSLELISTELKSIFGREYIHPEIRIYENISGIKKVFSDALTAREKIARYYVSSFNLEELLGKKFVDDFVKKRIQLGIKSLSLRSFVYKPEREQETTHAKQLREARFVPENVIIKPYMCIYDNKVSVISTKEEKIGFIIESKEFAEAQKAIFDMIWNSVAI